MNNRTRAYHRALAGLAALGISATGAFVSISPALAQDGATTVVCSDFKPKAGANNFTLAEQKNYKSGDLITVTGTGLEQRPAEGGFLAAKIDDGAIQFPEDLDLKETSIDNIDGAGDAYITEGLPGADGNATITLRLPEIEKDGLHNIRILAGNDGGGAGTWSVQFYVNNSGTEDGHCNTLTAGTASTAPTTTTTSASAAPATSTTSAPATTTEESAPVAFFGEDKFTTTKAEVANGEYQSVWDEATNSLYTAYAVGKPPVTVSGLQKINGDTLEVALDQAAPLVDTADESQGRVASYGIALNKSANQLWVTNTRQNTISVYNADDLSLVKTFEEGSLAHGRDVVVDEQTQRVYATSANRKATTDTGVIEVFDAKTLTKIETIEVGSAADPFLTTMALAFDENTGELFTVSMTNEKAAKIEVRNGNKVTVYDTLEGKTDSASGVAWDPINRNLWVISQGTGNAVVLDIDEGGKVIQDIATGAGALNAVYEPQSKLVYVANRTDGSVTAIDANTFEKVANLPAGKNPNHLSTDSKGNVYLVNKAGNQREDGTKYDDLIRISAINQGGGSDDAIGGFFSTLFNSAGKFFGNILTLFSQLINLLLGGLGRLF